MRVESTAAATTMPLPGDPLKRVEAQAEAAQLRRGKEAGGAPPSPASTSPGYDHAKWSPANNWGQVPAYKKLEQKPSDYDHARTPTDEAPLGYLLDGRPYSPYGNRPKSGKPRLEPVPSREGRDPNAPAAPGAATAAAQNHRYAPGEQKVPTDVVNLHNSIDECHTRMKGLYDELKKRHPETRYGAPVHPREVGAGALVRGSPLITAKMFEFLLEMFCAFCAKLVGKPEMTPDAEGVKETAAAFADASRYYGLDLTPKAQATTVALFSVCVLVSPYILEGGRRLLGTGDVEQGKAS